MEFIEYNGDKISKLSLGTVQFGLNYGVANQEGKPSQEKVNEIIDYVISQNINCFDTAQAYGNSEEVLGISIKDTQNLLIVSKLESKLFKNNLDNTVTTSIKKLNISNLYALLLHDSEILYSWNNNYANLVKELKKEKKIKYFGVSIYSDSDFQLAIGNEDIDIIQVPFNIFDQRALYNGWFKDASCKNKLIFIRSIYLQGLLLMDTNQLPFNLKLAKPYIEQLERVCKNLNMSKNQLAIAFVNTIAKNSVLLFGCDNIEQAKQNLENFNNLLVLNQETLEKLYKLFSKIDEKIYNPTRW